MAVMASSSFPNTGSPDTGKSCNLDFKLFPKQCFALGSQATEILYGGSCGGGKSHLARVAAITFCAKIPRFSAYLFRRLLPDLIKTHIEGPSGFRAILAPWVEAKLVTIVEDEIRFNWNGSKIFLCHCQDEKDVYKYWGAEMHLFLPDELTQFSEKMYRFLRARCRAVGLQVPPEFAHYTFPKIIATSNPGNVGHVWVKNTFIDYAPPLEIVQVPKEEGGMLRQFIPARVDDNPALLNDDPHYKDKLSGLGSPAMVKAYLDGDWNIIAGAFFPEFGNKHVVPPFKIPDHWLRFRGMDWGSYDPFHVGWWTVASEEYTIHEDGVAAEKQITIPKGALVQYREWYGAKDDSTGLKLTVEEIAQGILSREDTYEKFAYSVAGVDIFAQKGGPSLSERFAKYGIMFRRADNQRIPGWDEVRHRLRGRPDDGTPMLYIFNTCINTVRLLPSLQHDDKKPEDAAQVNDHIAEQVRYACMSRPWSSPTQTKGHPKDEFTGRGLRITLNEIVRDRYSLNTRHHLTRI